MASFSDSNTYKDTQNIKKMVIDMLVATAAFVIVLMRFIGLKAAVVKHCSGTAQGRTEGMMGLVFIKGVERK